MNNNTIGYRVSNLKEAQNYVIANAVALLLAFAVTLTSSRSIS